MPVSLHTHSWYSLLQGTTSLESLLERAASCGYTTLSLTDTNNLYGAIPFVEQAFRRGIRPILGACLRQRQAGCVALIAEPVGYRSLCRILSRLHLRAETPNQEQPLTELLVQNPEGLHVLVEDPGMAGPLREAFGRRLWLEVVRPARSIAEQARWLEAGRRLGLQPVASTAAHFALPTEYATYRLVTAMRKLTILDRLPRQLPITPDHHLVDACTLQQRFRDLPEAVRNTDMLAEQLRSDVLPHDTVLPPPRLPHHLDEVRYLHLLCERGLRRRDLGGSLSARQRLREELAVIEAAHLAGYFLVVRDIARHARRRGHSMALRGSAGNSLVCYLLEITDVDPLRFGLSLERFLHPGRIDLPDIDLDFDWKVRDEVIAHVFRRYGPQHTARISSHLFLQPRSALREASRVHGLSNEQISRMLEEGELAPLEETRGQKHGASGAAEQSAIRAAARLLLGRPHHLSIHPGGIVITPRPIEDYVPLQMAPKGVVITQFEKDALERIGLVKIDLLGNRGLATVDEALRHVRDERREATGKGQRGDTMANCKRQTANGNMLSQWESRAISSLSANAWDDEATVSLLQRGDTLGVNQLESPAMRHLLIQMKPAGVDDVIQALAMIRPGAASVGMKECYIRRRRGLEPVRCIHPLLEVLLRETQGLMLYDDDALCVVQALTGLAAPAADRFRKRIMKHQTGKEALALGQEFLQACERHGIPRAAAAEQWVQLAKFNHYSFCKSHAVSYGLIAWQAAYLKAHHPLAFWTAALNNNQGMYPRRVYIEAIKRAGIEVRLPCVNRSAGPFVMENGAIRTGLDAIASLDESLRALVLDERQRHGPYHDLANFRRRVQPGPEALGLLIRCGAFDFTQRPRPALFLEAELQQPAHEPRELFPGQLLAEWSPTDYEIERRQRDEWELLGFLTGPPLMSLFRSRLPAGLLTSEELPQYIGRRVKLAGLVATARRTPTADGRQMQFVTLEDEWGLIEVTLFPGACPPVGYLSLGPYLVTGVVEQQYDVLTVTAKRFERACDKQNVSAE